MAAILDLQIMSLISLIEYRTICNPPYFQPFKHWTRAYSDSNFKDINGCSTLTLNGFFLPQNFCPSNINDMYKLHVSQILLLNLSK